MNTFVTEISEKDFRKLKLKGYFRQRIDVDEKSHRLGWVEHDINEKIDEEKKEWNKWFKNEAKCIVVAIHKDQKLALEYEKIWKKSLEKRDFMVRRDLPDGFYYWDKYLNHSGASTYQIGCGIDHLYSTRDYWEARGGDYWQVKKNETEAIYIVHLEFNEED